MIKLLCPQCGQILCEIAPHGAAGTLLRTRCHNRHCRDKPMVVWEVTAQGTVLKRSMVDRRSAAIA